MGTTGSTKADNIRKTFLPGSAKKPKKNPLVNTLSMRKHKVDQTRENEFLFGDKEGQEASRKRSKEAFDNFVNGTKQPIISRVPFDQYGNMTGIKGIFTKSK